LQKLRRIYLETGDIDIVIEALQQQLVDSLRNVMLIEDTIVDRIVELGWGVAGERDTTCRYGRQFSRGKSG